MSQFRPAGIETYMSGYASGPTLSVTVMKLQNGYTLQLDSAPPPPKRRPPTPSPFVGMDPDELIDRIIESMSTVARAIQDKSAGEHWKESEDREKLREGFKALFPGVSHQIQEAVEAPEPYVEPRHENLVFESKIDLIKYLTENL